jgi:Arc/MetJ-type ribon-helix-helix transcriptional regulator
MIIQLTPEDEQLIQERLRSGVFHTVQEVIHHALQVQEAEESRLALHNREVGERLERAIEEFDQGGGIPGSQVRQRLQEMKASRLAGGE